MLKKIHGEQISHLMSYKAWNFEKLIFIKSNLASLEIVNDEDDVSSFKASIIMHKPIAIVKKGMLRIRDEIKKNMIKKKQLHSAFI